MTNYHMHSKEFLVGAVVGSLLGGVAALLAAPKSGQRFRRDLCDAYCDLSDKTQDVANQMARKGRSLAKNVGSQTCDWSDKARCFVENIKGWIASEEEEGEENAQRDLLIGGVVGGVLGAVAGLVLAPKSGSRLRQDLADTYHDMSERTYEAAQGMTKKGKAFARTAQSRANKWLELAKGLVEELTGEAQESDEDITDRAKHRLDDMMEWASVGWRLWQGLKSRR
jgi:gas vesicle protein